MNICTHMNLGGFCVSAFLNIGSQISGLDVLRFVLPFSPHASCNPASFASLASQKMKMKMKKKMKGGRGVELCRVVKGFFLCSKN